MRYCEKSSALIPYTLLLNTVISQVLSPVPGKSVGAEHSYMYYPFGYDF